MSSSNSGLYEDHISLKVDNSRFTSDNKPDFLLYVMDISYFSGKLEIYFRYRDFNFQRIEPTMSELFEIKKQTGTSQTPLVYDMIERKWLRDTTYIIKYMEEKYVEKSCNVPIYPECQLQRFFSLLLEDFADEYMWRPAMYMRWEPGVDSKVLSTRFIWEFVDDVWIFRFVPTFLRRSGIAFRQWLFSVFGEGIEDDEQHAIVKSQYYAVMDTLQDIFQQSPFLLGSHPTLVDFGLIGPFFRHFSSDPTPRKILQQQAPAVYEWVGRMWNCKQDKLSSTFESVCDNGTLPTSWNKLFPLVAEYLQYLHQNALAWRLNKPSFKFLFKGGNSVAKHSLVQTVPYRTWCRLELQRSFNELKASDHQGAEKVKLVLLEFNCWEILWKDGTIECPPEFGTVPPLCKPHPGSKKPDTPKWSMELLLLRYFKERLQTMLLVFLIIFATVIAPIFIF